MNTGHEYPVAPAKGENAVAERQKHAWLHNHPYITTTIGLASIAIIIFLIASAKSDVMGTSGEGNWVGDRGYFLTGDRQIREAERLAYEKKILMQPPETRLDYIPIQKPAPVESKETFDGGLDDLLSLLTQPLPTGSGTPISGTDSAFSFIPKGLIRAEAGPKQLTQEQQALRAYGNDVGSSIQSYESLHTNSPQILKDHAEDRKSGAKAAHVERIGTDMVTLGEELQALETMPSMMRPLHTAYATAYITAGTQLIKIAKTTSDEEYLASIESYNASVESLAKRYLAIATLLSANNVPFSAADTGSIFVFNSTLSF